MRHTITLILEHFASIVNPQFVNVGDGCGIVNFAKFPLQVANRKICDFRQILNPNGISEILLNKGCDFRHLRQRDNGILLFAAVQAAHECDQ